jgi:hypothetical protein
MEVRYHCSLADYKEAISTHRSKSLQLRVFTAVFLCALITFGAFVGTALGFRQGAATVSVVMLLTLLWLIYAFVVFPWWVNRDFRRHPNFPREQFLRIDGEALHKKSEIGNSETRWPAYTNWRETQNLFVLYLGHRLFEVIPKRALSKDQLQELRRLLHEKLPENASKPDQRGASASSKLA